MPFELVSNFNPDGDQPKVIEEITANFRKKQKKLQKVADAQKENYKDKKIHDKLKLDQIPKCFNTILGVTGSGKTFVMANVIKNLNRPCIILAQNKTLAAQLYNEFKSLSIDAKFLGRVPNSELPKIINKYPIYVLCSNYEGNPKTLLEAMSCERAVIGTNRPGINNIINHNLNGVLCDSSVTSLRESIIALIHDKNKRLKMGRAARRYIVNRNSMTSLIKLEMLIYNQFKNTHKFNFKETSK